MCAFRIIVSEAVFINIIVGIQNKIPPMQKYIISISQLLFHEKTVF
jgi:hypothetical protein